MTSNIFDRPQARGVSDEDCDLMYQSPFGLLPRRCTVLNRKSYCSRRRLTLSGYEKRLITAMLTGVIPAGSNVEGPIYQTNVNSFSDFCLHRTAYPVSLLATVGALGAYSSLRNIVARVTSRMYASVSGRINYRPPGANPNRCTFLGGEKLTAYVA